jgi:4-diphosphocytidyl-2-C-methyl-D-erythritol kinase
VRPAPGPVGRPLLLALAPFPLATAAVYGQVREFRADAGEHTRRLEELLRIADCGLRIADCAATLINDLEEPAFALRPELRTCLFDLRQADVIAAGMSGSGPTLFALLKETDSPSTRARIARWEGDWQVRLVRTVDRGWLEEGPECPWQPFNGGLILP